MTTRRSVLALAGVALAEIVTHRGVRAVPDPVTCVAEGDNCTGANKVCCPGLTCETTGNEGEKECKAGTPPACTTNEDCPPNGTCVDGSCQFPAPPQCETTADCPAGSVCENGVCRFLICTGGGVCPPGSQCLGGFCVAILIVNPLPGNVTQNVTVLPAPTTILSGGRQRRKKRRRNRRKR